MIELRPYQVDVLSKIRLSISKLHKKILVFAPTGFGKTVLAYEIIRNAIEKNNSVLFTSHRIQLAKQSFKKFDDFNPNYLQGQNDRITGSLLTVATIQTLINREIEEPKIVIIDEVHYAYESKLIQSLFEKFPNAIFIGLSATPLDDRGYLIEGFDSIIDDYQTGGLIKLGYLTPFKVYSPFVPDLSKVRIQANEYNKDDLSEVIEKPDIVSTVVENYVKHGENRKFLCFALSKEHAHQLSDEFNRNGIKTEVITADTTEKKRESILEKLQSGIIQGVVNIEILTAGFDEPSISCIILATPSKSWRKFIQCCGRGIRIMDGKKDCVLLDLAGAIVEHGMPDTRRKFIFGKKISRVIDRELGIDDNVDQRKKIEISEEKQVFLKKIGSLLDLYEGKFYAKEDELQSDVNSFLEKTDFFWWRQNSGKMFKDGRWIHFASKSGLPDNTVFYADTSFYFGLELKTVRGYLTTHQKQTLPEMTQRNVLFFICESVYDVYKCIEHVEKNVKHTENQFIISKSIFDLPERQKQLRQKLKLPLYKIHDKSHLCI